MDRLGKKMITLEQVLAEQEDLDTLCADRPLITDEIFAPNAWYGNNRIIRDYAGWEAPIKGIVPHGVHLRENWVWESEAKAPLPLVFCTSPFQADAYSRFSNKIPVLSASPFDYLTELAASEPTSGREGTIFFLAHSTHHIHTLTDFDALANSLEALDPSLRPVTICVYWRDYQLGSHLPFQKRGFPIVSAGHMYDPLFLWRFYHLCSMHRYSSSNGVGSHLFYSIRAGCSFFFMNDQSLRHENVPDDLPPIASMPRILRLRELFAIPQIAATKDQQSEVDYYLGTAHLDTRESLRSKLRLAERLDWSFVDRTQQDKSRMVVPCALHRWIADKTRRPRLVGRRLLELPKKLTRAHNRV